MVGIVIRWLVTSFTIHDPALVSGVQRKGSAVLCCARGLGVLNAIVRPVLILLTFR
jgi:uncharacterized membrane protein YvlD (DUF360 family)